MNRFSQNGDGKSRAPNDRITSTTAGQVPDYLATDQEREAQIIAALAGRYEELEALWQDAEDDLKRFRIHNPVEHLYSSENHYENGNGPDEDFFLNFRRWSKGWQILHGTHTDHPQCDDEPIDWKPINECTVELRVKAIGGFEGLRKKVIEEAEKSVPRLDSALAGFRKILKG